MELNYKKIGLLAGFLTLVAVIGFLIYFLFFRPTTPTPPATPDSGTGTGGQLPVSGPGGGAIVTGPPGQLPGTGVTPDSLSPLTGPDTADATASGGLTQTTALSQTPALNPTLGVSGNELVYYNPDNGKFYRASPGAPARVLTDKTFFNVENVTWAPNREKAVLEYPDGSNIVYNFQTGRQFSLPKHWKDFNFSPDSGRLAAKSIGADADNRWLIIANDDGSGARALEPIGDKDATVYVSWSPHNQSVAMYSESIDFDRQRLYFVGLNRENFKSTVIDGRGFEHIWNPSGDTLLYSVYSSTTQLKPSLWAVSAKGETIGANRRTLELQTWAHKCTFADTQTLYCAVPKSLPEGAGLFPELAQNSVDELYRVNLATGSQTLVAVPQGNYNMSNIIVSDDGKTLYFTDAFSDRLYTIALK